MYIVCKVCGLQFKTITNSHLKKHGMTLDEYRLLYPGEPTTKTDYISHKTSNSGPRHWHWKGGVSGAYRKNILFRDDFKCQNCGANQDELKLPLCVHVVDKRKSMYDNENLISLCRYCLNKTRDKRHRVELRNKLAVIAKDHERKRLKLKSKVIE